jgi:hypothetical protein
MVFTVVANGLTKAIFQLQSFQSTYPVLCRLRYVRRAYVVPVPLLILRSITRRHDSIIFIFYFFTFYKNYELLISTTSPY